MATAERELDCIVIGGGLAGLATAVELVRSGRSVRVLEAGDAVGGRARTVWHRGRPVDRGFQSLFRGYQDTRAFLRAIELPRRDLRPLAGGLAVHDGVSWNRLGARPDSLARFGALTHGERARLVRLGADVARRAPAQHLIGPEGGETTEEYLRGRGFGADALEGFFRPLFGAIFLDRSLSADAAYFRFLLGTMVRGGGAIPSDGHGMIAEWAVAAVRKGGGMVETGARVTGLELDAEGRRVARVRTADGREHSARFVVLAVAAPEARALLEPVDAATAGRLPTEGASQATAAFALRSPLYRGRLILLNADRTARGRDGDARVDLVCQTTNITRPRSPEGPHIVVAMSVTTGGGSAHGLARATAELVGRWAPGFPWEREAEPLGVTEHAFAQWRPLPGVRRNLPGHRTALDNLVLAGDLTAHPSIEGAVGSGTRAAGIVDALIP